MEKKINISKHFSEYIRDESNDYYKLTRQMFYKSNYVAKVIVNGIGIDSCVLCLLEYHDFEFVWDLYRASIPCQQLAFVKIFGMALLHGANFDEKCLREIENNNHDQIAIFLHEVIKRFPGLHRREEGDCNFSQKNRCNFICRKNSIYFKRLNNLTNELFGSLLLTDFGICNISNEHEVLISLMHTQMSKWAHHSDAPDEYDEIHNLRSYKKHSFHPAGHNSDDDAINMGGAMDLYLALYD